MDGNLAMNSYFENMSEKDTHDAIDAVMTFTGNSRIAEFMEWQHHADKDIDKHEMENLKYHSSWDWLMPVVEKISKVPLIGAEDLQDTCYPRTFGMLNLETGNLMVRFNGMFLNEAPKLIDAVWMAVVEFVNAEINNVQPPHDMPCGKGQNNI